MAAREYGQHDGITRALELIGERWALLIVRDLLVGPRRYTDLKHGLPRIPTNIHGDDDGDFKQALFFGVEAAHFAVEPDEVVVVFG